MASDSAIKRPVSAIGYKPVSIIDANRKTIFLKYSEGGPTKEWDDVVKMFVEIARCINGYPEACTERDALKDALRELVAAIKRTNAVMNYVDLERTMGPGLAAAEEILKEEKDGTTKD